jgi:hypothetical protein
LADVLGALGCQVDVPTLQLIDLRTYSEKFWKARRDFDHVHRQPAARAKAKPRPKAKAAPNRGRGRPKASAKVLASSHRVRKQKFALRAKVAELEAQVRDLKQQLNEKDLMYTGKHRDPTSVRKNLSVVGGYKLAMHRNTGHASAEALTSHLDVSITRPPDGLRHKLSVCVCCGFFV